jgi:AraC-like DNA-binding protein
MDQPSPLRHDVAKGASTRFMWITPGRVFYGGLLGAPTLRRLGSWTLYFSCDTTLRLSIEARGDAAWHEGRLAVVPPYRSHRLASAARHVCQILIEPETIDVAGLNDPLRTAVQGDGMLDTAQPVLGGLLERLCAARDRLASQVDLLPADDVAFDALVFGTAAPKPALDPRIIAALETLKDDDNLDASAQELADRARLSFHRFLHLFSNEVGVPLRTFRSWKRARGWLKHVTEDTNLTDIALRIGYADSAHFSRSVRQIFGLQPKDFIAGCRRLALHREPRKPSEV